jgi:integrase
MTTKTTNYTFRDRTIDNFRDRIHSKTRTRLSKEEWSILVKGFVDLLIGAKAQEEIKALCEEEIKLLEEGYPQPSVAKYITRYRKAIAIAIEDGSLPLTKANSHRFIHQQRVTGLQKERLEHWALTYLKYSPADYESIDKRSQETNREKQLNLRLVPVERYLEMLRGFLEKKGQFEARWLATAIAGVTGRRFAEVMAKGTFTLTEHPYLLRFEGQLKSRAGHGDGYNIVTLFPAAEVLEAIERLRQLPEVKAIAKLKGKALSEDLNRFNQKLNNVCSTALMQVVPPMEGKKSVSIHNLRSLYGAIAVHFFCPERQHEYAFVQHFLGHVMNSPATGHYFRYALSDDQDALLRTKGVMLDKVQELPLGVPEKEPVGELDDELLAFDFDRPTAEVEGAGVSEESEAKPKRRRRHKVTAGGKVTPVPKSAPDEWNSELELKLEQMRAEFESQIKELRQESNVGWFVRRVEGLERENLALRLERDKAIAAMPKTDDAEVVRLKKEKEAIALELKLAQEKLDTFRRLLNGGDTEAIEGDTEAQPSHEPIQVGDLVSVSGGEEKTITKTRGPKAGKAFRRAEAIVLAIKDWNRLYPSESFAINAAVLEMAFRIHRQAAKAFLDAFQNELWDYHQEIGVESPQWHNRGKDTEKLKAFVTQQLSENPQK